MDGELTYPDMGIFGTVRILAVAIISLGNNGDDGHDHTQETILEDSDPNDLGPCQSDCTQIGCLGCSHIEPGKPAARLSPDSVLTTGAFLHPGHRPDPVLRLNLPEILLLRVQVRCNVGAE